jgi:hypothetical protein
MRVKEIKLMVSFSFANDNEVASLARPTFLSGDDALQ